VADPEDRWRIKEFAGLVGVQEPTLRAWERRYHLLAPDRSSGGYRLYSSADQRRVRSMQAHMARGLAAAQAAGLAVAESTAEIVAPSEPGALIAALIGAAEDYDATRFDALLDAAFTAGLLAGIRDVVLPLLVEIGERWATGALTVGHEHFASHLLERRLLALAQGWEAGRGPRALLACPPRERHTLGLVCFGLVLADQGWRIAYLGADTPISQILEVGASMRPNAVVLCSRDPANMLREAEGLAELGAREHMIIAGDGVSLEMAQRLGAQLAEGDPVTSALKLAEHPPPPPAEPFVRPAASAAGAE